MRLLLCIGAGSGIGGILRYLLGCWIRRHAAMGEFPWHTLTVNLLGCLLLGLLVGVLEQGWLSSHPVWRSGLTVGLCGGFTTFSTLTQENLLLLREGAWIAGVLYLLLSVLGGLLLVLGGYALGRMI